MRKAAPFWMNTKNESLFNPNPPFSEEVGALRLCRTFVFSKFGGRRKRDPIATPLMFWSAREH